MGQSWKDGDHDEWSGAQICVSRVYCKRYLQYSSGEHFNDEFDSRSMKSYNALVFISMEVFYS